MTATEQVILVDSNDKPIGTAEKLQAHQLSLCHRAFSVFILKKEPKLKILLQQRAANKYHSGDLWTNTCCSHPRPNEKTLKAAERRLQEEMGITASLQSLGWFHYIAHFENGLVENEIDHVFIGFIDDHTIFKPNPHEVKSYRWISLPQLKEALVEHPENFTPWLKQALEKIEEYLST